MLDPTRNARAGARLSEDLTVILLRGNGSPRTFRLSLVALQKSLTALGFAFGLAIAAALFLLALSLFRFTPDRPEPVSPGGLAPAMAPPLPAPAPPSPPAKGEGFWTALTTRPENEAPRDDEELRKEVQGLREDIARLNAQANGRRSLAKGANEGLLQFFGPRNVAEASSPMQVKRARVARDPARRELYVDFELHNGDPAQRQSRGYIVVLAKTPSFLMSYPDGVFHPAQNVVLDFTKGETFAVSRFREARAAFPSGPFEGKRAAFQVLLFSTEGKVIADLHVEDGP